MMIGNLSLWLAEQAFLILCVIIYTYIPWLSELYRILLFPGSDRMANLSSNEVQFYFMDFVLSLLKDYIKHDSFNQIISSNQICWFYKNCQIYLSFIFKIYVKTL